MQGYVGPRRRRLGQTNADRRRSSRPPSASISTNVAAKFLLTDAIWKHVVEVQPPPVRIVTGRPSCVTTTTPDNPAISDTPSTLSLRALAYVIGRGCRGPRNV